MLAGEVTLPSYTPTALEVTLPPAEAAAVARALACPDLFLIDAPDRAARDRVLLHVVHAASQNGERILVLSPDAAAADRIAQELAADRTHRVVRALADDENPLRPSTIVTRLTSQHAGAARAEQLRRDAAQTVTALEARLARIERAGQLRLQLEAIERERSTILEQERTAEAEVRSGWSPPAAPGTDRLAELRTELATVRAKKTETEAALQSAPPPKKSGFFARLLGRSDPPANPLHAQLRELTDREAALQAECDTLAATRDSTAQSVVEEIARRRTAHRLRLAELDAEAVRIGTELRQVLPPAGPEDTVENGTPSSTKRLELERELSIARTRVQELADAGPDLARRLLAETRIMVGTPGSVDSDPVFDALPRTDPLFDRIILDCAEELTEPAFERFASLARRQLLAGDATPPPDVKPHLNGHGRNGHHRVAEPPLLVRLAAQLDHSPWIIEAGRLVFRLIPLPPVKRRTLQREPLLDHPDVELGVTADGEARLAEIAFPASTSIADAKTFLVSQLGEVLLRPCGEVVWQNDEAKLTAAWPLFAERSVAVTLEAGVCEHTVGHGIAAFTTAVTFDRSEGWTEDRAAEWLAARYSAPESCRCARLPADPTRKDPLAARRAIQSRV